MQISLLDAAGAERFKSGVNDDPEFKLLARDMSLNLLLEIGAERRLLKLRDGELRAIRPFAPMTEPADVTIRGAVEFWRRLLSPVPPARSQNLYAGVHAANCEVAGDIERYNAYFPALNRMIDVMRQVQNG